MAFLRLLLVITLTCFTSALLAIFDFSTIAIFTSVGFGFAGMMMAARLDEHGKGVGVVAFLGLFLVATAGFMAMAMTDHPLWVNKVSGISLEEASRFPHASVLYFRNAKARPDLMESAEILGSSGKGGVHTVDNAFVVPVVPEAWTRDVPVLVWAVATRDNYQEQALNWKRSVRSGARTVGLNVSDYKNAIDMARGVFGLTSSAEPLLIELSPNPEDLVTKTWIRLGWIIGIDFLLLLMAVFLIPRFLAKTAKD